MSITTTATSKGQLTIPKSVRDKIGLKRGTKVDIYPTKDGFEGKVHRKSRILDYIGDLKHLDRGEPLREIREKAQAAAAREIVAKMEKNENSRAR